MSEKKLPTLCMRCNEEIKPGQQTEVIPFIPRWGMSALAHVGCKAPELNWYVVEEQKQ
jgi:hypothetical protein